MRLVYGCLPVLNFSGVGNELFLFFCGFSFFVFVLFGLAIFAMEYIFEYIFNDPKSRKKSELAKELKQRLELDKALLHKLKRIGLTGSGN